MLVGVRPGLFSFVVEGPALPRPAPELPSAVRVAKGRPRRPGRLIVVAVLAAAVVVASVGPASGAPDSVVAAEQALARSTAQRESYERKVRSIEQRHAEMEAELRRLGALEAELTEDLAAARRELREFAVAAYVDGGRAEVLLSTLSVEQAQVIGWQTYILAGQSLSAGEAARRFEILKGDTTPERLAVAEQVDRLGDELQAARFDAIQAAALERDAEAELARRRAAAQAAAQERAAAERAAAERAAAQRAAAAPAAGRDAGGPARTAPAASAATPAPTPAPPIAVAPPAQGDPTAAESAILAKIRRCESGGNYSILSPSGRYRGAYQFDVATWRSVGGSGDPAAASPAEQDYRALLLLRMRGTRPWPHCGR